MKVIECMNELESNKLTLQSLQNEYAQLKSENETKIETLQEENTIVFILSFIKHFIMCISS